MDQLNSLVDLALDYLEDKLPPPLYSLLLNALSHLLALCTAAFRVIGSLASTHPQDWDTQTILPPIITLLAAYLALLSVYRTATWAFRLAIWFVKWGSIIGVLSMGAGWLAAVTHMNGEGNNGLADAMSNLMNGRSGNSHPRSRTTARTRNPVDTRPRNGFKASPDWQYQEGETQQNDAQNIMQNIVDTAQQIFDGSGWWELSKIMAGAQKPDEAREERAKAKSKSR